MSARKSKENDTFLYFGFGSNLLRERIHLKNPSAVFVSVAELKDFRLCFGRQESWRSGRWHGGVASVERSKDDSVWGVVWRLSSEDLPSLDEQEEEGTIYTRFEASVTSADGECHTVWTYQLMNIIEELPSPQYLEVIRKGAKQNTLPAHYRTRLEDIPHNGYQGDMAIFDSIKSSNGDDSETFLYFAFGSNLLESRLKLANPSAVLVGPAKLQDYKLCFQTLPGWDINMSVWRGAGATIQAEGGQHVWGVVWRMDNADIPSLDKQEKAYNPMTVTVTSLEGKDLECRTYQLHGNGIDKPPSPHYMKVIVEGATRTGIPPSYVDFLRAVPHNGDGNPPEILQRLGL